MADDGMILNFSVGEEPLNTKANLKGGPWRARRRVQRQTTFHATPGADRSPVINVPDGDEAEFEIPPAKRIRTDVNFQTQTSQSTKHSSRSQPSQKQFISSLFSYNPTSTTIGKEKPSEEEEKIDQPSNAPLTEELNDLTSLGLSQTLATHLVNKLNVTAPTAIQKEAVPTLIQNDTDAFIQAETGSGKTLAYLLPIVQRIMALTARNGVNPADKVNRHSGLFAIIMAPTRELSKQIYTVLESLLRCAHWIVPGIVIGGEKKKSEKARLRKGMNILVATPGRLADHLANTEVLDVSNVRWLVLDEGDRLMELGFEDDIKKIVEKLDSRKDSGRQIAGLPAERTNVLCSATMKMDVQRLGEISLREAVHIRAETARSDETEVEDHKFAAPAQLKQTYAVVPAKLRLVTLVAILKRAFSRRGSVMKVIVFMSCADSVDFHYEVLTRLESSQSDSEETDDKALASKNSNASANEKRPRQAKPSDPLPSEPTTFGSSPLISSSSNSAKAYRLHGSLAQAIRTKTLNAFSKDTEPGFLICTDVASRGLDLPNVDLVIEYDPPFSKEEHIHRIGRTARAGRDGRASIFLLPGSEEGYVNILREGRRDGVSGLTRHTAEDILRKGFTAKVDGKEQMAGWDVRATEWELEIERWALADPRILEMARRAFQSHVRAYATHIAAEREMFNIKDLHLGHLAKAFGLRDRPGSINVPGLRQNPGQVRNEREKARRVRNDESKNDRKRSAVSSVGAEKDFDVPAGDDAQEEAARKMRMKMKMAKMKMAKMGGGADEFNLA
ncbi:DEAD-domain-containing protein [Tothia fuscella]|uniref:ATP-dependent RNA helicase n=1 Tax=Tothia fuscella TaxID=1048955 RepID=A0A9P4NJC1_9PEZI|nr:DEAD-domain-containing protein [Tothia fuscella]